MRLLRSSNSKNRARLSRRCELANPARSWHGACQISTPAFADAQRRYRTAIEAHANAKIAARDASDALSVASATLRDLRSREHEIEDLARKIDQLNRHKQVLVDAAERQTDLETAVTALERAKKAQFPSD